MTQQTPTTARQRRAAQLAELVRQQAELEAAETAYERAVRDAVGRAGYARCEAVETLYELLGIDEITTTRTRRGVVQTVRTDTDETQRAQRLVEAVTALMAQATSGTRAAPAVPAGALAPLSPAASEPYEDDEPEEDGEPAYGAVREDLHESGWQA